jgi:hypothetical protein
LSHANGVSLYGFFGPGRPWIELEVCAAPHNHAGSHCGLDRGMLADGHTSQRLPARVRFSMLESSE